MKIFHLSYSTDDGGAARAPFLGQRFLKFVMTVPPELKGYNKSLKQPLKDSKSPLLLKELLSLP